MSCGSARRRGTDCRARASRRRTPETARSSIASRRSMRAPLITWPTVSRRLSATWLQRRFMRGSITVRRPSHLSHRSAPDERAARASFLCGLSLPGGARLDDEQVAAALAWAETRLLSVQGPPGTGKTVTAAAAVVGEAVVLPAGSLVLVSAPTHTAVDYLMQC